MQTVSSREATGVDSGVAVNAGGFEGVSWGVFKDGVTRQAMVIKNNTATRQAGVFDPGADDFNKALPMHPGEI